MIKTIPHFIQGKKSNTISEKKLPVYNPATGMKISEVVSASSEDIQNAITSAKNAFLTWSHTPPLKRARILFQLKALLEKNSDRIAASITEEHGKTLEDAKGEVARAIELVEFSCGTPHLLQGHYSENVGTDIDTYTLKQPLGVCVGISPFNFPIMISAWMMIPAIACGNTFILKPSEKDPSSTLLLAELLQEAGLPDGVFNILQGDKSVVDALITHPDVMAVSAVGSTPVAESIYHTAISHGKRAHTFGGAKNHAVVMPDCDVIEAADAIVGAAFGAAGERCMALSAVVAVTDDVADALISRLKIKITQLKIAPGTDPSVDMGPLITAEHLSRVKSYVDVGVAEGASLVLDGCAPPSSQTSGFFMQGCLFDHVQKNMRIYQEEIFGPVLCVLRVKQLDEAIALINDNPYGNGVCIFTRDGGVAKRFASAVTVGMVGVNVPIPVPVAFHAFGGWKRSWFGDIRMHGAENVHFYTRTKTVTTRWPDDKNNPVTSTYHMLSH